MKRKNLKSIIHNFCHSFQSFDYRISQYPLIIELSSLYREQGVNRIEIDIINKTVQPETALRAGIIQRIQDYADWLPELCETQDVNPEIIKTLELVVTVPFESATVYKSSRNERVVQMITDYSCTDDLGLTFEGSIIENEVVNKQAYNN